ncbi:hypothetical protein EIN_051890 [Entamoeba invadens IP1]|uniref:hypothetical protein n=1 Tax=Entamoeba invadens IP1 TaxID=370355 RepID=UPI0002C3D004|nr:hypothetical protein EIN_051890 [Entamoeba invadens IP1]ELP93004.1 hypothetical protein EIN_051890 [Entamoeba invadens IP1]|eukprot:XP_004259775.1 hypothetical protein EIN_051890 [Entamoeba invadens IP1]
MQNENNDILKSWTGLSQCTTIFDSENDELTARGVDSKITGKTNIVFLVEDTRGNVFGSFHGIIPPPDKLISSKDDPKHFVFTLKNPHNIPPTKFPVKDTNGDVLHVYDSSDCRNVFNVQSAFGVTCDSKVFVYESIINGYTNLPPIGCRVLVNDNNKFFDIKRLIILQFN